MVAPSGSLPSGTAWRCCPARPSTCSSTTEGWPACRSPWLRCTNSTRMRTASSTWPTPRRRCLDDEARPASGFIPVTGCSPPAAVNTKECIYCNFCSTCWLDEMDFNRVHPINILMLMNADGWWFLLVDGDTWTLSTTWIVSPSHCEYLILEAL